MRYTAIKLIAFAALAGCVASGNDGTPQTQSLRSIEAAKALFQSACLQNLGHLSDAKTSLDAMSFDVRERTGQTWSYGDSTNEVVAAFSKTQTSQRSGATSLFEQEAITCSVMTPYMRQPEARRFLQSLDRSLFQNRSRRSGGQPNVGYYIEFVPSEFGKPTSVYSQSGILEFEGDGMDEVREQLSNSNPNVQVGFLTVTLNVTEITE